MSYIPTPQCLQDRVILVTGVGNGIGETAAKAYAKHGATVILMGRKISKLEKLYDFIVDANWPQPAIYPLHMEGACNDDYLDLAKTLKKNFGHLDGLLHNTAYIGELTPLADHAIDVWFKTMQVNLNAPFMLTQACLPLLRASDNGSVIFTSHNTAASSKSTYWGAYGIAKNAITNLAKKLAIECQGKPRINIIEPGALASPMRARAYPGEDFYQHAKIEVVIPKYIQLMDNTCKLNGKNVIAQNKN